MERSRSSTSATVALIPTSSSSELAPSASAYDAKRRTVTVKRNFLRPRHFLHVVFQLRHVESSDHRAELLRRLEHWNGTSGDFDGRTRAGIARHARLAVTDLERAETAHFDVLLPLQSFLDRLEEGVDHAGAVFLGDHWPSGARNLGC